MARFPLIKVLLSVLLLLVVFLVALTLTAAPPTAVAAQAGTPVPAQCRSYRNGAIYAIPDATNNQSVSSGIRVTLPGNVSAMTVTFGISHTYPADLAVNICNPDRTKCWVVYDYNTLPYTAGNYTFSFSSAATDYMEWGSPPDATYAFEPDDLWYHTGFGFMYGHHAAGQWQLSVGDYGGGDVGTLRGWGLTLCTDPNAIPVTSTPTPTVRATATQPTPTPTFIPGVYVFRESDIQAAGFNVGYARCDEWVAAGVPQTWDIIGQECFGWSTTQSLIACNLTNAPEEMQFNRRWDVTGWNHAASFHTDCAGAVQGSGCDASVWSDDNSGNSVTGSGCDMVTVMMSDMTWNLLPYRKSVLGNGYNVRRFDISPITLAVCGNEISLCTLQAADNGPGVWLNTPTPTRTAIPTRTPTATPTPVCPPVTPVSGWWGWWSW